MTREEELRNQYIYERSLLEQYGYQSVTTFEEWLEIKGIQVDHDMVKSGNEHPHTDDISNYPNENHKDRTCKNSVTFKGWVARDNIGDEDYPRTFLYVNKPERVNVYYFAENLGRTYDDSYGKLGSYDLKNLLPELKFKDGPIEVEVTVRLIEDPKK